METHSKVSRDGCNSSSSFQSENFKEELMDSRSRHSTNIIFNHDFSGGLQSWKPNSCHAFVNSEESASPEVITAKLSGRYAIVTNRKKSWQGLEQEITNRVSTGRTYTVCALVGVSGAPHGVDNVEATVRLEYGNSEDKYLHIGRVYASVDHWEKVEGTFALPTMPDRVVFIFEGPSPGVDLLVRSVLVYPSSAEYDSQSTGSICDGDRDIILNSRFDDDLNNWFGSGCKIALYESMEDGKVLPMSGKRFACTADRTENCNGIQQEITGRVQRKLAYEFASVVRIFGNNVTSSDITATLWVQEPDFREHYIEIASVKATDKDWVQLQGKFLINCSPARIKIYLEGPPRGTDILLDNLVVKLKIPPSSQPIIKSPAFGVNIIANSNLSDDTNSWFPLGNCTLTIGNGSPDNIPPMARDSLGLQKPLSGRYVLVTNRTETWMGPAQMITDKLKLYLTYQVSAWVRIGSRATRPQNISITLKVDDEWVNCGEVEVKDEKWLEISGSFRIEKKPAKVMAYVHGPDAGLDLLVAGLHIFPVDRHARFSHLKLQTEKIRKRDIILKFTSDSGPLLGNSVKIRQTENSFPFGSCINRKDIDNEDFVDFFSKNFNWAVFGYELKWDWMEQRKGKLNYKDADELLKFCISRNIQVRGHCIFWEVEDEVQSWVSGLKKDEDKLTSAVENRLSVLLTRYKGKFKHYDVNNEMLHGSFYQDHLGKDIRATMFEWANQLDPSAILFVNDYHIEDGCDSRSSPEKYIEHILELQEQGAPVGGIGIQGHIESPVGPIVCSALDKLRDKIPGLPIWFTELDVSSDNEYVRADDLEVMLREAFAHPAVDGVILWGFWELLMNRDNAHLVNAEGDINEAGNRYLALKQEWLSHAHGHTDEQGQFKFRGFHGSYEVEVHTPSKKVTETFVVDKGDKPLVISINL